MVYFMNYVIKAEKGINNDEMAVTPDMFDKINELYDRKEAKSSLVAGMHVSKSNMKKGN